MLKKEEGKPITIVLCETDRRRLEELKALSGLTKSALIRKGIEELHVRNVQK